MSLIPAATPRKRAKLDTFTTSLDELTSQLQTINSSLASDSPLSHSSLLRDLGSLALKREAFEGSLRRVGKQLEGVDAERAKDWREELDRAGVEMWNRSTILKDRAAGGGTAEAEHKEMEEVAQLRYNAFKIISLGAPATLREADHVALLTLSTKTYSALCYLKDASAAEEVLSVGAEHTASIHVHSPLGGSDGARGSTPMSTVRVVLAHYTTRITLSVKSGKMGVAEWIKNKVKAELLGLLKEREICKLASTAFEAGRWLLASKSQKAAESTGVEDRDPASALPWLLWALELLEGVAGDESRHMRITVLAVLAEAYLDPSAGPSRMQKAEEAIMQLLRLQPTGALSRRRIKLLIARNASDGEMTRAFVEAATASPWTEDQGARLLQLLHKLPDDRRSLKSSICESLVEVAVQVQHQIADIRESTSGGLNSPFLAQVVMAAVLVNKGGSALSVLFQHIANAAPSFRLDFQSAFLCITYVWRSADKAHAQGKTKDAAELYLLCTSPMLAALEETWPKSYRKAGLCYGELHRYDEAEASIAHDPCAKGRFVRIYNLIGNGKHDEAATLVEEMINAEGFSLKLLLWTAKAAEEAGSDVLICTVYENLVFYSTRHDEVAVQVDCMVVFRQLIRALIRRLSYEGANHAELLPLLRGHFDAALKLATSLAEKSPLPEKLIQGVAWLHRTGYSLGTRFVDNPALGFSAFFGTIAGLIALEASLSTITKPETWACFVQCRLVALTEHLNSARATLTGTPAETAAYKLLLEHLDKLETEVGELSPAKPRNEQFERTLETLGALKLEAWSALGEWEQALKLAENACSSECTERSIRLLAQKAVDDGCPPASLLGILKATLKNLFGRGDLDTSAVASWIRLMVGLLIEEKPSEAAEYFSIAVSFIASLSSYPMEEQSWLTITAWNKGIDAFGGQHPSAGHHWCSLALRLARSSQAPGLPKMEADYEALREEFPEDGEGMALTEG